MLKIAASLLSCDFGRMNEDIQSIEKEIDELHIDVMDGHFVPNLTFGPVVIKALKTKLKKDCHLMVTNPGALLEDFAKAGADQITVHVESFSRESNLNELLYRIRELGLKVGVSLKPQTSPVVLKGILDKIDQVLVMTVEPGFGGQAFMPGMVEKIKDIRKIAPKLEIAVDGGINAETAKLCVAAGANVLVAGSYIFGAEDRGEAIRKLKN